MSKDKDYEALLEDYEEALMRLMMYRAGQEEGRRLLEEAEELERSGAQVPAELDERCRRLIQADRAPREHGQSPAKAGDCDNVSPHGLRLYSVARAVTVALLAAVLLFCVAYAVNEQFRVDVLNFGLELREKGTWFFFSSEAQSNDADQDFPFEFTYIPDGYELILQRAHDFGEMGIQYTARYERLDDEYNNFFFDICPINSGDGMLLDTENAEVINTTIHGQDGWIIKKVDVPSGRECTMYFWFDLENGYSYAYCSIGVSDDEVQKIFDNIVINEKFTEIF